MLCGRKKLVVGLSECVLDKETTLLSAKQNTRKALIIKIGFLLHSRFIDLNAVRQEFIFL